MRSRPPSLGFVGLGVMGRPMASHLAAAGHAMTLYDTASGRADDVAAALAGASVARTPAELAFMCGGAAGDLERVRPLLDRTGKAVFHLGPLGAGHAMKCLNNLVTVISRSFDDPFKLSLMLKDIGIAMQLARSVDVPAPVSALGQELWRAAGRAAEPEASVSELARWVERMAATEISAGAEWSP